MSSAAAEQSTSGAPAPLASMASLASASERLRPAAVEVRGAYKNYGDTVVLAGIDMTVPRGTIYGLLGASGCGKTTLLSCIAGRRHLDAGSARVFGEEPAPGPRLGFMPQFPGNVNARRRSLAACAAERKRRRGKARGHALCPPMT
ncbi:Uncharacterized protein GBIM_13369 [Gryllus bimaculatus]|nr:Uncharacterized protein GBIM_13369 [Gryllus bimaculatus]